MIFTIPKPSKHDERIDQAGNHFRNDCADHKLTIERDDGVYRHLRFSSSDRGNRGLYWFDIHTSHGILTFHGDAGTWVFSRTEDMFEFFRGHRVNPGYWAEKVIANDRHGKAEQYDHRILLGIVRGQALEYAARTWPKPDPADWDFADDDAPDWSAGRALFYRDLIDLLRDDEFQYDGNTEGAALSSLMSWTHYETVATDRPNFSGVGYRTETKKHRPFGDLYESGPFTGHDHLFLYVCHAIVWGIEQYDTAKAEQEQVPA